MKKLLARLDEIEQRLGEIEFGLGMDRNRPKPWFDRTSKHYMKTGTQIDLKVAETPIFAFSRLPRYDP